ncbi:MAG: N-acetyltransferase [Butyrivibrio sp.]|nr:N-acetyltransferase [Butyrivibrio sp.]
MYKNPQFKETKDKIWLENDEGKTMAFIEFPEFETGKVEVTHTVVDESLRGQGIAGKLTEHMAKKLLREGKRAELTCSYAVKWFNEHRVYENILLNPEEEYEKASNMQEMACQIPKHRS